jgi:hypothetical protein
MPHALTFALCCILEELYLTGETATEYPVFNPVIRPPRTIPPRLYECVLEILSCSIVIFIVQKGSDYVLTGTTCHFTHLCIAFGVFLHPLLSINWGDFSRFFSVPYFTQYVHLFKLIMASPQKGTLPDFTLFILALLSL